MHPIRHLNFAFIPLLAVVFLGLIPPDTVRAEVLASEWVKGFHSRVRLTAANLLGDGDAMALYAGVDIRLDKDWKTYWKAPGDGGGIPPEFDWSKSQNVSSVRVLYPAPKILKDTYGNSIGYKSGVLFPVVVTPADPLQPVRLRLHVYFGVCEEICIPAEATLALDVAPGARATIPVQRDLMNALAKVPGTTSRALAVRNPVAVLEGDKPHLRIVVQPRDASMQTALFVASRDGDYFPIPKPIERSADGTTVFRVDLAHLDKPRALIGKTIDLTGTADDHGARMSWTIGPPVE